MYRRRLQGWMKYLDFILVDIICFQVAFLLSCFIRHGLVNPYSSLLYRNYAIISVLFQIFILISFSTFQGILARGYYREFISAIKTSLLVMLSVVFYLFSIKQGTSFSRVILCSNAVYYTALAFFSRSVLKYIHRIRVADNKGKNCMVLITSMNRAEENAKKILEKNYGEYSFTGVILVDKTEDVAELPENIEGIPVVANRQTAVEYICRDWIDEVFFDVPQEDDFYTELINVLIDMSMVTHVRLDDRLNLMARNKYLQNMSGYTVVTVSSNILRMRDALAKRALDILGGIAGCICTGILFLTIGPAIYLQDPGPVFFSQMRVGRNGKLFKIYKFRSMYMDAEERKKELLEQNEVEDGMMFKMENDPRIIGSEKGPGKGIGNFIRKYSLDEFPQFLNILKGDMSLVGTRPPTVDEWEKYNPHHRGRLSMKPGLTGMWQVSGRSDIQDFEEVVALDRQYIAEWSFGLDIKILLKTVAVVLHGEGAK